MFKGNPLRLRRASGRVIRALYAARGVRSKINILRCVNGWAHAKLGHQVESREVTLDFRDVKLSVDVSRGEVIPYLEIWHEHTYDVFPEFSSSNLECVVDVGANIGVYTLYQTIRKKAKRIIAFEPAPSVFPRLIENLRLNRITNVNAVNAAVGEKPGRVEILETQMSINCHVTRAGQKGALIPCVTLDGALSDVSRINLLKVDVEGYELQVLAGAYDVLKRTDRIAMEAVDCSTQEEIKRILANYGFRFLLLEGDIQYFSLSRPT